MLDKSLILIDKFNKELTLISDRCEDKDELTNELYRLFPVILKQCGIEEETKQLNSDMSQCKPSHSISWILLGLMVVEIVIVILILDANGYL